MFIGDKPEGGGLQFAVDLGRWKPELHPRDSHGRFRNSWRTPLKALKVVERILARFRAAEFRDNNHASGYLEGVRRKGHVRRPDQNASIARFFTPEGYDDIQSALRAGYDTRRTGGPSKDIKNLDDSMAPLPDDALLTWVGGPEVFGLTPDRMGEVEEWTGKLVSDKGYIAANLTTPEPVAGPHITWSVLTPRGTRGVVVGDGHRDIILDREQPLQIMKVEPDGHGGMYVYATAMPRSGSGTPRGLGKELTPREKAEASRPIPATPEEFRRRGLNPDGTPIQSKPAPAGTPAPGEQGLPPHTPVEAGAPVPQKSPTKQLREAGQEVPMGAGHVTTPEDVKAARENAKEFPAKERPRPSRQVIPEDVARRQHAEQEAVRRQKILDERQARLDRAEQAVRAREQRHLDRVEKENEKLRAELEKRDQQHEIPHEARARAERQHRDTEDAVIARARRTQKERGDKYLDPNGPAYNEERRIHDQANEILRSRGEKEIPGRAGPPSETAFKLKPKITKAAAKKAAPAAATREEPTKNEHLAADRLREQARSLRQAAKKSRSDGDEEHANRLESAADALDRSANNLAPPAPAKKARKGAKAAAPEAPAEPVNPREVQAQHFDRYRELRGQLTKEQRKEVSNLGGDASRYWVRRLPPYNENHDTALTHVGGPEVRRIPPGSLPEEAPTKAVKKAAPSAKKLTPEEQRAARIASALHEDWRKTRLQDDGTYEPRIKKTKDQNWIDAHGTDEVDIANTKYEDLPDDWQKENREAAQVIDKILQRHGGSVDLNDEKTRLEVGEEIHREWLKRNEWAKGGELDVPFADLPRSEQDKDIAQLRIAMAGEKPTIRKAAPAVRQAAPPTKEVAPRARRLTKAEIKKRAAESVQSRTGRPEGYPERYPFTTNDQTAWQNDFPEYSPRDYTAPKVLRDPKTKKRPTWADPEDVHEVKHPFTSAEGPVELDADGRPLNPHGRTGIRGRGELGRWGANPAGDAIVTRTNPDTGETEILTITRGEAVDGRHPRALPGGMLDSGESGHAGARRELREETGANVDLAHGDVIHRGFVDDPRNTDNAWMESTATHRHLTPREAARVKLTGPQDKKEIRRAEWVPIDRNLMDDLYASHGSWVQEVVRRLLSDDNHTLTPDEKKKLRAASTRRARKAAPSKPVITRGPAKKAAPVPHDKEREAREKRIERAYVSGKSLREVGESEGISSESVRRVLTKRGIQLRPRGGARAVKKATPEKPTITRAAKRMEPSPRPKTLTELRKEASEKQIPGRSKMSKAELERALAAPQPKPTITRAAKKAVPAKVAGPGPGHREMPAHEVSGRLRLTKEIAAERAAMRRKLNSDQRAELRGLTPAQQNAYWNYRLAHRERNHDDAIYHATPGAPQARGLFGRGRHAETATRAPSPAQSSGAEELDTLRLTPEGKLTGRVPRTGLADAWRHDTGPEGIRVEDLTTHDGYLVKEGTLWRHGGTTYLVEHHNGAHTPAQIHASLQSHYESLHPDIRRYQRSYAWFGYGNPRDHDIKREWHLHDFESVAFSDTRGNTTLFRRQELGGHELMPSLDHELGHNLQNNHEGIAPHSGIWHRAADRDAHAPVHVYDFHQTYMPAQPGSTRDGIRFDRDPDAKFPDGVTNYGKSNANEDFGEAFMLYHQGPIGRGRLTPDGPEVDIYFRDLFPHRAELFDRILPRFGEQQKKAMGRPAARKITGSGVPGRVTLRGTTPSSGAPRKRGGAVPRGAREAPLPFRLSAAEQHDVNSLTPEQRADYIARRTRGEKLSHGEAMFLVGRRLSPAKKVTVAKAVPGPAGEAQAAGPIKAVRPSSYTPWDTGRVGKAKRTWQEIEAASPTVHKHTRSKSEHDLGPGFDHYIEESGSINNGVLRGLDRLGEPRGEHAPSLARSEAAARVMDEGMRHSQLRDDVEVWRGITHGDRVFGDAWGGSLAGREFTEPGFMSGSADRRTAESWAAGMGIPGVDEKPNPVVMRVRAPKGTHAVAVSAYGGSEHELILDRNLRYRVVRDTGPGGKGPREIDIEIIGPAGEKPSIGALRRQQGAAPAKAVRYGMPRSLHPVRGDRLTKPQVRAASTEDLQQAREETRRGLSMGVAGPRVRAQQVTRARMHNLGLIDEELARRATPEKPTITRAAKKAVPEPKKMEQAPKPRTLTELRKEASDKKIPGRSKMNRQELEQALAAPQPEKPAITRAVKATRPEISTAGTAIPPLRPGRKISATEQTEAMRRLQSFDNPMSRKEAYELLAHYDRPTLVRMARDISVPGASGKSRADLRREIVEGTTGRRLDSIATRGFRGRRPGEGEIAQPKPVVKKAAKKVVSVPERPAPKHSPGLVTTTPEDRTDRAKRLRERTRLLEDTRDAAKVERVESAPAQRIIDHAIENNDRSDNRDNLRYMAGDIRRAADDLESQPLTNDDVHHVRPLTDRELGHIQADDVDRLHRLADALEAEANKEDDEEGFLPPHEAPKPAAPSKPTITKAAKKVAAPRRPTVASVRDANAAKRWGKANGFEGRTGGWIYDSKGRPVAHGWDEFARKYAGRIHGGGAPQAAAKKATPEEAAAPLPMRHRPVPGKLPPPTEKGLHQIKLPDGTIAERRSKSRAYTHAVMLTKNNHKDADRHEELARLNEEAIKAYQEAIRTGDWSKFKRVSNGGNAHHTDWAMEYIHPRSGEDWSHQIRFHSPLPADIAKDMAYTEWFARGTAKDYPTGEAWTGKVYGPDAAKAFREGPEAWAKWRAQYEVDHKRKYVQGLRDDAKKLRAKPEHEYYISRWSSSHSAAASAARSDRAASPQIRDVYSARVVQVGDDLSGGKETTGRRTRVETRSAPEVRPVTVKKAAPAKKVTAPEAAPEATPETGALAAGRITGTRLKPGMRLLAETGPTGFRPTRSKTKGEPIEVTSVEKVPGHRRGMFKITARTADGRVVTHTGGASETHMLAPEGGAAEKVAKVVEHKPKPSIEPWQQRRVDELSPIGRDEYWKRRELGMGDSEALAMAQRLEGPKARKARVQEYDKLTREEFDALPEERRKQILDDLKHIRDSGDTQTIASNRTQMGTTIRGATADHVSKSRVLYDRFTRNREPLAKPTITKATSRPKTGVPAPEPTHIDERTLEEAKAAAPRPHVETPVHRDADLEGRVTKADLLQIAKREGMTGHTALTKDKLIERIKAHRDQREHGVPHVFGETHKAPAPVKTKPTIRKAGVAPAVTRTSGAPAKPEFAPGGDKHVSLRDVGQGIDGIDYNDPAIADVQSELDSGKTPAQAAKTLRRHAERQATHNVYMNGGWHDDSLSRRMMPAEERAKLKTEEDTKYAEGAARVKAMRDLADKLEKTRRPRVTTVKRAPAGTATTEGRLPGVTSDGPGVRTEMKERGLTEKQAQRLAHEHVVSVSDGKKAWVYDAGGGRYVTSADHPGAKAGNRAFFEVTPDGEIWRHMEGHQTSQVWPPTGYRAPVHIVDENDLIAHRGTILRPSEYPGWSIVEHTGNKRWYVVDPNGKIYGSGDMRMEGAQEHLQTHVRPQEGSRPPRERTFMEQHAEERHLASEREAKRRAAMTEAERAAEDKRHAEMDAQHKKEREELRAAHEAKAIVTRDKKVNSANLRQALTDAHGPEARHRIIAGIDRDLGQGRYGRPLPKETWRGIARDLGIKGHSRSDNEQIKAAIVEHFADADAARKADLHARKVETKDRIHESGLARRVLDDAEADTHYRPGSSDKRYGTRTSDRGGDLVTEKLAEHQGFDGLPEVVSRDEFEARRKKDIGIVLYRGVNTTGRAEPGMGGEFKGKPASEVHDEFREGRYHGGQGVFGNGTYMTRSSQHAKGYSDLTEGSVARYGLAKDAKIVEWPDLVREHKEYVASLDPESPEAKVFGDSSEGIGHYAMARGYDAIHVPRGTPAMGAGPEGAKDQYVILNRGKVIAEAPGVHGPVRPRITKAAAKKVGVPEAAPEAPAAPEAVPGPEKPARVMTLKHARAQAAIDVVNHSQTRIPAEHDGIRAEIVHGLGTGALTPTTARQKMRAEVERLSREAREHRKTDPERARKAGIAAAIYDATQDDLATTKLDPAARQYVAGGGPTVKPLPPRPGPHGVPAKAAPTKAAPAKAVPAKAVPTPRAPAEEIHKAAEAAKPAKKVVKAVKPDEVRTDLEKAHSAQEMGQILDDLQLGEDRAAWRKLARGLIPAPRLVDLRSSGKIRKQIIDSYEADRLLRQEVAPVVLPGPDGSIRRLREPLPTKARPKSKWGKLRDHADVAWNPETGHRPRQALDDADSIYMAKHREDAAQFLDKLPEERFNNLVKELDLTGPAHEGKTRDELAEAVLTAIREPEPKTRSLTPTAADLRAERAQTYQGMFDRHNLGETIQTSAARKALKAGHDHYVAAGDKNAVVDQLHHEADQLGAHGDAARLRAFADNLERQGKLNPEKFGRPKITRAAAKETPEAHAPEVKKPRITKAAKATHGVTRAELEHPVERVGAEAPRAATPMVATDAWEPGTGVPTTHFLAAEQALGKGYPSRNLTALDREARAVDHHKNVGAAYEKLDKDLAAAGIGENDNPRKGIREWFHRTFTPGGGEGAPRARGAVATPEAAAAPLPMRRPAVPPRLSQEERAAILARREELMKRPLTSLSPSEEAELKRANEIYASTHGVGRVSRQPTPVPKRLQTKPTAKSMTKAMQLDEAIPDIPGQEGGLLRIAKQDLGNGEPVAGIRERLTNRAEFLRDMARHIDPEIDPHGVEARRMERIADQYDAAAKFLGAREPAKGKILAKDIKEGDRILVAKGADGRWHPATKKTGATPVIVSGIETTKVKGRDRHLITGTDPEGKKLEIHALRGGDGVTPSQGFHTPTVKKPREKSATPLLADLRKEAQAKHIPGAARMRKAELEQALRDHEERGALAPEKPTITKAAKKAVAAVPETTTRPVPVKATPVREGTLTPEERSVLFRNRHDMAERRGLTPDEANDFARSDYRTIADWRAAKEGRTPERPTIKKAAPTAAEREAAAVAGERERRAAIRKEMRERTQRTLESPEAKARQEKIQKQAAELDRRLQAEHAAEDAATNKVTDSWLHDAGIKRSDLSELEQTGVMVVGDQVRKGKISKAEAARRLRTDDPNSNLSRIADTLGKRPTVTRAKKAAPAEREGIHRRPRMGRWLGVPNGAGGMAGGMPSTPGGGGGAGGAGAGGAGGEAAKEPGKTLAELQKEAKGKIPGFSRMKKADLEAALADYYKNGPKPIVKKAAPAKAVRTPRPETEKQPRVRKATKARVRTVKPEALEKNRFKPEQPRHVAGLTHDELLAEIVRHNRLGHNLPPYDSSMTKAQLRQVLTGEPARPRTPRKGIAGLEHKELLAEIERRNRMGADLPPYDSSMTKAQLRQVLAGQHVPGFEGEPGKPTVAPERLSDAAEARLRKLASRPSGFTESKDPARKAEADELVRLGYAKRRYQRFENGVGSSPSIQITEKGRQHLASLEAQPAKEAAKPVIRKAAPSAGPGRATARRAALVADEHAGKKVDVLPFYGGKGEGAALSQHHPAPFTVDGVTYPTAEHYMMASKARLFGDHQALERILATPSPVEAKRIGREVRGFDAAKWDQVAYDRVVEGNLAKFRQNPELRAQLLATGDRVLVEASPRDTTWGVGRGKDDALHPSKWRGQNLLGFALMDVRDQLRKEEGSKKPTVTRAGHLREADIHEGLRVQTADGRTGTVITGPDGHVLETGDELGYDRKTMGAPGVHIRWDKPNADGSHTGMTSIEALRRSGTPEPGPTKPTITRAKKVTRPSAMAEGDEYTRQLYEAARGDVRGLGQFDRGQMVARLQGFDEVLTRKASDRAVRHYIRTTPMSDDLRERMTKAMDGGDRSKLHGLLAEAERDLGLEPIGKTDDVVPFDPNLHKRLQVTGDRTRLQPGAPVLVLKRGFRHDGDLYERALVDPVPIEKMNREELHAEIQRRRSAGEDLHATQNDFTREELIQVLEGKSIEVRGAQRRAAAKERAAARAQEPRKTVAPERLGAAEAIDRMSKAKTRQEVVDAARLLRNRDDLGNALNRIGLSRGGHDESMASMRQRLVHAMAPEEGVAPEAPAPPQSKAVNDRAIKESGQRIASAVEVGNREHMHPDLGLRPFENLTDEDIQRMTPGLRQHFIDRLEHHQGEHDLKFKRRAAEQIDRLRAAGVPEEKPQKPTITRAPKAPEAAPAQSLDAMERERARLSRLIRNRELKRDRAEAPMGAEEKRLRADRDALDARILAEKERLNPDGLDRLEGRDLYELARANGVHDYLPPDMVRGELRKKGIKAPEPKKAVSSIDESVALAGNPEGDNSIMHGDSATMELAQAYARRNRNGTANRLMELRRSISTQRGEDAKNLDGPQKMLDELKQLRDAETDPELRKKLGDAIREMDFPKKPLPDLPEGTPPALRQLMEDLNRIPVARAPKGSHLHGVTTQEDSPIDRIARLAHEIHDSKGQISLGETERKIEDTLRTYHESVDGAYRMWGLWHREQGNDLTAQLREWVKKLRTSTDTGDSARPTITREKIRPSEPEIPSTSAVYEVPGPPPPAKTTKPTITRASDLREQRTAARVTSARRQRADGAVALARNLDETLAAFARRDNNQGLGQALSRQVDTPGPDQGVHDHIARGREDLRQALVNDLPKATSAEDARSIIDRALEERGIRRVGNVGDTTTYDPNLHDTFPESALNPGDQVKIARPGYVFRDENGEITTKPIVKSVPRPEGSTPTKTTARTPAVKESPEVKSLRSSVESGPTTDERVYSAGTLSDTRKVRGSDGKRMIRKAPKPEVGDGYRFSEKDQVDAEYLTSLVGRGMKAPVPAVYRHDDNTVYMDVAPGRLGVMSPVALREKAVTSPEGRRLHLLDLVSANNDRHWENMTIDQQGRPTGIDHAGAWQSTRDLAPNGEELPQTPNYHDPFNSHYRAVVGTYDANNVGTGDDTWARRIPFTRTELRQARQALEAAKPEFERLGHMDWYDAGQRRIDAMMKRAAPEGRKIRIPETEAATIGASTEEPGLLGAPTAVPRRNMVVGTHGDDTLTGRIGQYGLSTVLSTDTGPDGKVVEHLELSNGYGITHGTFFRHDGISYLIEHDGSPQGQAQAKQILAAFKAHRASLPPDAQRFQKGYVWALGRNPNDEANARKYGLQGFFVSAAHSDKHGHTTMWMRGAWGGRDLLEDLDHEFGHNVEGNDLHISPNSVAWHQAVKADSIARRQIRDFKQEYRTSSPGNGEWHTILFDNEPGAKFPRGVTKYGTKTPGEDYAESIMFYLSQGPIGYGRLTPNGPVVPIFFRDIFPMRARQLDKLFPAFAAKQKEQIKKLREASA